MDRYRRSAVVLGDGNQKRNHKPPRSTATDDRLAVPSRLHVGPAVWIPGGEGLRREVCVGGFRGRTAGNDRRTRVFSGYNNNRRECFSCNNREYLPEFAGQWRWVVELR